MRRPVELPRASRLLNHGPTVLVSAAHEGRRDVMAAAWAMPLDFDPPKVAVVVDRQTFTRGLIDASGTFTLQVPTVAMKDLVQSVGTRSGRELDKFAAWGIGTAEGTLPGVPLIDGCIAWLECRVISDRVLAEGHDLFLGEVVAAWADDRVWRDHRWRFDEADPSLRTLHHVAAGHYFTLGEAVRGEVLPG